MATSAKKKNSDTNKAKKSTQKKAKAISHHSSENIPNTDSSFMHFQGVRTHNLKNIDLSIPKNKITTLTGVSGSGKSSFAFDTLYKEGQYRYIESLGAYLRQFFNLGERPEIDYCAGLSPAIAIEQNKKVGNSRSSVGTLTEIDDYLRLLFAKLGDLYCYASGKQIKPQTIEQIMDNIYDNYAGQKIYLIKELGTIKEKDKLTKFVRKNTKQVDKGAGFTRYLISYQHNNKHHNIEYFYLETPNIPDTHFPIKVYGIFDRITVEDTKKSRLKEDIIKILSEEKKFGVYLNNEYTESIGNKTNKKNSKEESQKTSDIKRYTDKMYSPDYDITYPDFTPQHFSPNRQEGACPSCHGIGEILQVDMDKIIDPNSEYTDAILPRRDSAYGQNLLIKLAQKYSIDKNKLRKDLPERFLHIVINGDNELLRIQTGDKYVSIYYKGIEEVLKDQYAKGLLTVDFQAMLNMKTCPTCYGSKLRKESLHVFLTLPNNVLDKERAKDNLDKLFANKADKNPDRPFAKPVDDGTIKVNIQDLQHMKLSELGNFLETYAQHANKAKILSQRIIDPLLDRSRTIEQLGLPYISLHRQVATLSGGEIQRLRLAKQLGNKLTGITYVLDEPTIGLNDEEIAKTIKAIKRLQEMGNTIVVVEHHDDFIKASDWVIEMGPGAGDFGGNVTFSGPYDEFIKSDALTAQYITGKKKIQCDFNHSPTNNYIKIKKANKHNLQEIDVNIQLGSFTIITGASGAGKTTLMYDTLFRFMDEKDKFVQSYIRLELLKKGRSWQEIIAAPTMNKQDYNHYANLALQEFFKEIQVETIQNHDQIKNIVYVDQTGIGKTPRSCPATFIGTFDKIRNLFASSTQAKYLGFTASYFSFNSSKGACPSCNGYGYKKVELQFLPDTYVHCELCNGNRYKQEILDITRHEYNIAQILDMYVEDALEIFKDIAYVQEELQLMVHIGLWYLKMGQPAHTLSGGESQRLKLVKHLLKSYKWHTMYFLDEPTVGLHDADIEKLLYVIKAFLDKWDTILMIEHDKNLLQFADNIIHLNNGKLIK